MTQINSRKRALEWKYPRYKAYQRELRKVATEWFRGKDYPVTKRHSFILDALDQDSLISESTWRRNIILNDVADYIEAENLKAADEKRAYSLHQYLHGGLSSQAMLFNLVGPLIVRQDFLPLNNVLSEIGIPWPQGEVKADFEVAADISVFNEEIPQPTSIDLVVQGDKRSSSIFIEAKLSENEFGGCKIFAEGECKGENPYDPNRPSAGFEKCYLDFIYRTYWPQMKEHGILDGPLGSSLFCPLANHYQFFRELLFALHNKGYYVLLYDPRNPTFVCNGPLGERGLFPFLVSLLPDRIQDRVGKLTIDRVFEEVVRLDKHNDWTGEFAAKYYGVAESI